MNLIQVIKFFSAAPSVSSFWHLAQLLKKHFHSLQTDISDALFSDQLASVSTADIWNLVLAVSLSVFFCWNWEMFPSLYFLLNLSLLICVFMFCWFWSIVDSKLCLVVLWSSFMSKYSLLILVKNPFFPFLIALHHTPGATLRISNCLDHLFYKFFAWEHNILVLTIPKSFTLSIDNLSIPKLKLCLVKSYQWSSVWAWDGDSLAFPHMVDKSWPSIILWDFSYQSGTQWLWAIQPLFSGAHVAWDKSSNT